MDANGLLPLLLVGVLLDGENEILQIGGRVSTQFEAGDLHHHEDLLYVELRESLCTLLQKVDEQCGGGEVERVEVGDEDEQVDGCLGVFEMLILLR